MKIGIVLEPSLTIPGGVQEYARGLYDYFREQGHHVVIIGGGWNPGPEEGRQSRSLGKSIELRLPGTSASIPWVFLKNREIERYLLSMDFDILHFQGPGGFFNSRVLRFSQAVNILTLHVFHKGIPSFLAKIIWPWERRLNQKILCKIAVSEAAAQFASRLYPGEIRIVPNAVDTERFQGSRARIDEYWDEKINILFVGRLDRRKGILYLLKSFKELRFQAGLRLIIVGDGPERSKAERYARRSGMDDIVFLGKIPRAGLPAAYRTAHIFCAPATHGESFGIVLLEAMAAGLPVVAFANDGYKAVLCSPPLCDFLVAPRDCQGLSQKLQSLISDDVKRQTLSLASLEEVRRYSWDRVGRQITDLYQLALTKREKN